MRAATWATSAPITLEIGKRTIFLQLNGGLKPNGGIWTRLESGNCCPWLHSNWLRKSRFQFLVSFRIGWNCFVVFLNFVSYRNVLYLIEIYFLYLFVMFRIFPCLLGSFHVFLHLIMPKIILFYSWVILTVFFWDRGDGSVSSHCLLFWSQPFIFGGAK